MKLIKDIKFEYQNVQIQLMIFNIGFDILIIISDTNKLG